MNGSSSSGPVQKGPTRCCGDTFAWPGPGRPRAFSTCLIFAGSAFAEPEEPSPATGAVTETVRVLDARQAGDIELEVRGQGQDRVKFAIRNTSSKRLNVVLPPGLVAASATGQRGGGGFQSMGLGTPTNRPGGFGQFQGAAGSEGGLHSIPATPGDAQAASTVTVPAGKSVDLTLPAVCLHSGMPTPTGRDRFELMDVNEYTGDPRARKAPPESGDPRHEPGVAQAAMWRICNDVPFDLMRAPGRQGDQPARSGAGRSLRGGGRRFGRLRGDRSQLPR